MLMRPNTIPEVLLTTDAALPVWRYWERGVVVAGCYPYEGGPSHVPAVNAYLFALSQLEVLALRKGANAVVSIHAVREDPYYIVLAGMAIWLDFEGAIGVHPWDWMLQRSRGGLLGNVWGFVAQWTRDL